MVPLAPAGLKVWQAAQPLAAKTAFPAAAFPPAAAAAVVVGAAAVVVGVLAGAADVVTVTVRVPLGLPSEV